MTSTHRSAKKAVNLTVSDELLVRAKNHQINLSAVLESALTAELHRLERQRWVAANQVAIDRYNTWVAEQGTFGDSVRSF